MSSTDPSILDHLDAQALQRYPDYEHGRPPRLLKLHEHDYLDEYEKIWGRRWGAMGLGRLRSVGLIRPDPAWEGHPFFQNDPDFFLLRYRRSLDPDLMLRSHEEYVRLLTSLGVGIEWMEFDNPIGAYGPMRKLFMA